MLRCNICGGTGRYYLEKGTKCMQIKRFVDMLKECNAIVFFGGAGVSTESGVKDYRSKDGLYNTVKEYGVPPEEILSHHFFL